MPHRDAIRNGVVCFLGFQILHVGLYTASLGLDDHHPLKFAPSLSTPWGPHRHVPTPDLEDSTNISNAVNSLTWSSSTR